MLARKSIVIFCLSCIAAVSFSDKVFGAWPMTVQQKSFHLEFKVYRTEDMPANWFKTYDGFYVTKRIDNNWVYGQHTMTGMKMTDIFVGSVDPATMPELNEAYTYVPAGAKPVYIPPLPPAMQSQQLTANIFSSESQSASAPISQLPETKKRQETAPALSHEDNRTIETVRETHDTTPVQAPINTPAADLTAERIALGTTDKTRQDFLNAATKADIQNISTPINSSNISQDWFAAISYKRRYTASDLKHAIEYESPEAVETILKSGIDLNDEKIRSHAYQYTANAFNLYGSPLVWALYRALLFYGSDLEVKNMQLPELLSEALLHKIVLVKALGSFEDALKIIELLINYGVDIEERILINPTDTRQAGGYTFLTPLAFVAEFFHDKFCAPLMKILIEYGAKIESDKSLQPAGSYLLSCTPLITAILANNIEGVITLVQYGASRYSRLGGFLGTTAQDLAKRSSNSKIRSWGNGILTWSRVKWTKKTIAHNNTKSRKNRRSSKR